MFAHVHAHACQPNRSAALSTCSTCYLQWIKHRRRTPAATRVGTLNLAIGDVRGGLVRLGLYVGDFFHDWHGVTTVDLHVDNVVGG
jgi:hypothetical protein